MRNKELRIKNKERRGAEKRAAASPRRSRLSIVFSALVFILSLGGFAAQAHASTLLTAPPNNLGLIGHWTFDANHISGLTVYDSSVSGNNGTSVNTPQLMKGIIGDAMSFNGSSDIVVPAQTPAWGADTFSIWIYQTGAQSNIAHVFGGLDGNNSFSINYGIGIIENGSNDVSCIAATNDTSWYSNLTAPVTLNQWHLVTCTLSGEGSGQTGKLYIDGMLKATYTGYAGAWGYPLAIGAGAGNNNHSYFFKGELDDARLYTRVLSAQEVAQLYSARTPNITSATQSGLSPTNLVTNGLVGYWTFDGANTNWYTNTTADVSGHGYTGELVGMPTSTTPVLGKFGQAFHFSGVSWSDYVAIANSSSAFNFGTNNFSFSAWFKPESLVGGQYLFSKYYDNSYSDYDISFAVINDYCPIGTVSIGFMMNEVNGRCITENNWHHVVGIRNGLTLSLYLDGNPDGTYTASSIQDFDNPGTFEIGNHTYAHTFNGPIDDFRVYDRALSPQEVKQLYNAGAVGTTIDQVPADYLSNGLVGYWPFDGNKMNWASNLALDASGNGNNGTVVNMKPTNAVMGVIGQALSFNGTSQYVSLGNAGTLQLTSGTLSAWIKTSTLCSNSAGNYCDIISKNNAFGFFTYSNGHLVTYDWGAAITRDTGVIVTDGKWHYVTMTFQSGVTNGTLLYIDGKRILSTTITVTTQANEVEIGNDAGSSQYFPGIIDDVRIYNRALSASEVQQLYNLGR